MIVPNNKFGLAVNKETLQQSTKKGYERVDILNL